MQNLDMKFSGQELINVSIGSRQLLRRNLGRIRWSETLIERWIVKKIQNTKTGCDVRIICLEKRNLSICGIVKYEEYVSYVKKMSNMYMGGGGAKHLTAF